MASKLLIDGRWLRTGRRGIGVFTYSMLAALSKTVCDKMSVTVAIPSSKVAAFEGEFGNVFSIISLPDLPDPLLDLFYFSFYLVRNKFDLVHFTGNTGMLIGHPRCKVLLTVHDVSFMKPASVVPWPGKLRQIVGRIYRKIVVPICARRSDCLVTVSEFAANDLLLELGLIKAPEYIYHGLSEELSGNGSLPSIVDTVGGKYLVIGGSDPQKNIRRVVQAFSLLYRRQVAAPSVIIIGLTLRDYLSCNSDAVEPNISFIGYQDNSYVQAAIRSAKCVIVPSFYESFGLPVIDSLSAGKAVICSERGALPEIGRDVPVYFNPESTLSLIEAIEHFECFPDRSEKVSQWRAEYEKLFSWEKCASRYYKMYINLTGA